MEKFLFINPIYKLKKFYKYSIFKYYFKNLNTVEDAILLINKLNDNGFNSCDKLMEELCNLFSIYLPSEDELAKLSLLHQSVMGTLGIEEYSTLLIWTCAIQSIIENENQKEFENKNKPIINLKIDVINSIKVDVKILLI
jgi:hypothetical protein